MEYTTTTFPILQCCVLLSVLRGLNHCVAFPSPPRSPFIGASRAHSPPGQSISSSYLPTRRTSPLELLDFDLICRLIPVLIFLLWIARTPLVGGEWRRNPSTSCSAQFSLLLDRFSQAIQRRSYGSGPSLARALARDLTRLTTHPWTDTPQTLSDWCGDGCCDTSLQTPQIHMGLRTRGGMNAAFASGISSLSPCRVWLVRVHVPCLCWLDYLQVQVSAIFGHSISFLTRRDCLLVLVMTVIDSLHLA